MLYIFYKIVYENWVPIALTDKNYRMPSSVQFVLDALAAMSDD